MSSKTMSREEKLAFATEQFEELLGMGLSRKGASEVLQAAGPRLAVATVEWVRVMWDFVKQDYANAKARASASEDLDEQEWGMEAASKSEVISELRHYLTRLSSEEQASHYVDDVIKGIIPQPKGFSPDEIWKLTKMADAALVAIKYLNLKLEA